MGPWVSFDYPDVSQGLFRLNRLATSLAQENEIQALANAYSGHDLAACPSILMGVSRGASAIINFVAHYNPTTVHALVLESPFDCVESIACNLIHSNGLSWVPWLQRNALTLMSMVFCKYKPNGIRPKDRAGLIRSELPILIICSAQDALVPVWSSINVYLLLRESGHHNTYLYIVPSGKHAQLITHAQHGTTYCQITHAFYQKFGFEHDPLLAMQGRPLLDAAQPSKNQLARWYPPYALETENKPNPREAKNKKKQEMAPIQQKYDRRIAIRGKKRA